MPLEKAQIVLDSRRTSPPWPPGASRSTTTIVRRPLRGPIHGGREARRPPANDDFRIVFPESAERIWKADQRREFSWLWLDERRPIREP